MAEIAHLDRVATAGVLSASIAHELNQPLGAILSNAETIETVLAADSLNVDLCKEILADIRRDDRRASDIIKNLRTYMRSPSELERIDLNDAVRDVIKLLGPKAKEKHIALQLKLSARALPVYALPIHIQQVILNLVLNGIDAVTHCQRDERRLSVQTASIGAEGEVSIWDNGAGIPTDALNRIFEKFFTTKTQGMGLGLTIARKFVETYGGRIWAENKPPGGAVLHVRFPLINSAAAPV